MAILIDTGAPDVLAFIPNWFRDLQPADAPPDRIAHDFAYHLIGDMTNPKTFKTVRKHLLQNWSFLHELAEMHPDVFDEVLQAFVERSLTFD